MWLWEWVIQLVEDKILFLPRYGLGITLNNFISWLERGILIVYLASLPGKASL